MKLIQKIKGNRLIRICIPHVNQTLSSVKIITEVAYSCKMYEHTFFLLHEFCLMLFATLYGHEFVALKGQEVCLKLFVALYGHK